MIALSLPVDLWADASDDTEALLEAWLVAPGEQVRAGQVLANAVIVKASVELTAPADGVVAELLVPAGETFARGTVLGSLAESATAEATPPPVAATPPPVAAPSVVGQPIPFTGMRGSIVRNLSAAWRTPRVAVGLDVEISQVLTRLEQHQSLAATARPTITALMVFVVARALQQHPRLNALVSDDGITAGDGIHVAVAVSLEDGLVAPVIRHADQKSLAQIATELAELAAAARAGNLSPGALQGGTFSISNLGGQGIDWFTPILNPPQAAILGVGRVRDTPVVRNGSVQAGKQLTLTLVFDHRAIDGAPAAQFLARVGALLAE